jgi:hypothetical protein
MNPDEEKTLPLPALKKVSKKGLFQSIWASRYGISIFLTLLIGCMWLFIGLKTKEKIPMIMATILLAPNIIHIVKPFLRKRRF